MILHRHDYGWLIPFLVYLAITLRIIFNFIPVSYVMRPTRWLYNNSLVKIYDTMPHKLRTCFAALLTIAVICVGSFVPEESVDNTRGNRAISILGLAVILFVLWLTSRNRKCIPWHTVIGGMLTQFVMAVFVLKTKAGYDIFNFISYLARAFLGFADQGTAFVIDEAVVKLITSLRAWYQQLSSSLLWYRVFIMLDFCSGSLSNSPLSSSGHYVFLALRLLLQLHHLFSVKASQ